MELVGHLAMQESVALPGITVDAMRADPVLAPLVAATRGLAERLEDTVLEAQSECWWAATALYTALARAAGQDAAVEKALAPAVDFFAVGRRRKTVTPAMGGAP